MNSLENRALVTDVARRGQSETTDKTSAHIGQNISVQVGHDKNLVVVGKRVGDHLQARVVQELSVELNVGEILRDVPGGGEEQTVGHLHDGSLVDGAHLLAANLACVLECVAENALRCLACDELDALHDTVDDHVLNARVLALSVLTDQDSVHIVVGCLEALNATARAHVGEEVESTTKSQIEGDVALADGGGERALERDEVAGDAVDGLVWDDSLAVLEAGRDVDGLPLDGHIGSAVDVLDGLCDLRSDTVTLDERNGVLSIVTLGALELCDLGGSSIVPRLSPISSRRKKKTRRFTRELETVYGARIRLTWASAGVHLEGALARRRHCLVGAAKARPASIVTVRMCGLGPIAATRRVVAGFGGVVMGWRRCEAVQETKAKLAEVPRHLQPFSNVVRDLTRNTCFSLVLFS